MRRANSLKTADVLGVGHLCLTDHLKSKKTLQFSALAYGKNFLGRDYSMPYQTVKVPGKGYKVKSESGTMLSKKALSKKRADSQRIAATLSSLGIKKK